MDNPRSTAAPAPGYETRDANARGVFYFLVILGIVLVAAGLVCWGLFRFYTAHEVEAPASESPFAETRQLPLGPELQVNPRQDWLKYQADQQKSLESFDWENRSAGTVRVPIELAMELLVKKGVPVRGESVPGEPAAPKVAPKAGKKP